VTGVQTCALPISRILDREPYNQNILSRLGDAYICQDNFKQARDFYERSLDLGFDAFALIGMSRVYRNAKNFVEAEACCNRVLMEKPGFDRAIEELSLALIDKDLENKLN